MSTFQDTQFSKKSTQEKKKFDIQNLNFKNLGLKFKSSNKITSQNLQEESNEDKQSTYNDNFRETESKTIAKRKYLNDEKIKDDLTDDQNVKILNKTIENLRIALLEKNEEITILKKNFKEKINLIENENRKSIDNLETKYKLHIDNLINTYESKIKEIQIRHKEYQVEFDENYGRLQKEVNLFLSSHIEKRVHDEIISKINYSWNEKFENMKSLFNKKLKEMMNFFDKPEYRLMMEKLKFYMKFKEKLNLDLQENEKSTLNDLRNDEIELLISKMKIHLIDVETGYLKGLSDIEHKYQEFESKFQQSKADDKLENLKKIILDKFTLLENMNIVGNEDNNILATQKNNSAQVLNLLNEFKNKKKLFTENLEIDFNFTTSFIKEYELKNKVLKTDTMGEVKKRFDRQSTFNNNGTEHVLHKKVSLFSSEMEKNPVYDEENFTKFDYPKILVHPNMKHFDDFRTGEENIFDSQINPNIQEANFIDNNNKDFQSLNSKDYNFIRLKTKK